MKRLAAALTIALTLLLLPVPVRTQPAATIPRVAILCVPSCTGLTFDALLDELRKLGWVESTTITIERREAGSRLDQLPALGV